MKKMLVMPLLALYCFPVFADNCVDGHYRKNGTYVQGYCRTDSNNTQYDNYSSKPNYNPYTGEYGRKNPEY